ncbi:hypothetical protein TIFTF001_009372 [Ficus carica]|uniref:Uncharacterized protein n=1 Tax=Ficus carica TaxID=3494 RepID=A0AA88A6N3_FICCA|nr:hypothetical protein TIFTF001_009372 [Ficus carica]
MMGKQKIEHRGATQGALQCSNRRSSPAVQSNQRRSASSKSAYTELSALQCREE